MNNIGILNLANKSVNDIKKIIEVYIEGSRNMRKRIISNENYDECIIDLIRDTYLHNILMRYIGLMTIISNNPEYEVIDNRIIEHTFIHYNKKKFKGKIIDIYNHFYKTYEENKINFDYCKFLLKIIDKCNIPKKCIRIKRNIRMIENKIQNVLSINPVIKLDQSEERLDYNNYCLLLDKTNNIEKRHIIENKYLSRTDNVVVDFAKLIVMRNILSRKMGYDTYFRYLNKNKIDTSDVIKELIIKLNSEINKKAFTEIYNIYKFQSQNNEKSNKIMMCDIIRYNRIHKNDMKFHHSVAIQVIFNIFDLYFNITIKKEDVKAWNNNTKVYLMVDKITNNVISRFYLDIDYDDNKNTLHPVSVRLSDRMQINKDSFSIPEIALIANYKNNLTYSDVITLFREFGSLLLMSCYNSRVGPINYDEEFSNYLPYIMEYFALDKDIIEIISFASFGNNESSRAIVDHILLSRNIDICFMTKLKCVYAKFDHLIHNSIPLIDLLMKANTDTELSQIIFETYKDIYKEIMDPLSEIFITDIGHIDPIAIINEINGSQGYLYSNLMNEIFAYATYWIIKNYKVKSFKEDVLRDGITNYRDLVRAFIKKKNVDCFTLYISNVLSINNEDNEEDTTKFCED